MGLWGISDTLGRRNGGAYARKGGEIQSCGPIALSSQETCASGIIDAHLVFVHVGCAVRITELSHRQQWLGKLGIAEEAHCLARTWQLGELKHRRVSGAQFGGVREVDRDGIHVVTHVV
jgi:hypothetical protein